ncbi:hypothetical protein [Actinomyces ruminicola]|uniref:LysM peptidoglycan-binding domain-containing protein n=1 Tax=Actinomyces ruminicola TaxID=332524 RepID=UPI0011C940E6|nr:hypothetical protein [Actinomyces ruminicola]
MTPTLQRRSPGPARFRSPTPEQREPIWRSILSVLVLATVIIGLPCLLLWQAGPPPLPQHLDVSVLTRAVTAETVLGVLTWVVWLAWLQFTACTVVEVASALRGRGLPAHVPLAGGTQVLVRRLVASALVLGAVAAPAAAAEPVTAPEPTPIAAVQAHGAVDAAPAALSRDAGPAESSPDAHTQATAPADQAQSVRYMLGDTELPSDIGSALLGQRVYIVQPPAGRYHDNMWDIAERTLGDGRAYQQIYDLNVGRVQPDGRSLELARLIQPGWYLIVPESAQNVERVVAVPVDETAQTQADAAAGSGSSAGPADGAAASDSSNQAVAAVPDVPPAQLPAVGALMAAALTWVLADRRRRGLAAAPDDDALELERLMRVGADPHRSDRLTRVLSSLDTLPGKPVPYAVVIDDAACRLLLPRPLPQPPEPWTTNDGGATWSLAAGAEPVSSGNGTTSDISPGCTGLVTIGRDEHGADILINLGAVDGDVVVGGEPTAAAELVAALALELCTNPWSQAASVITVGLPTALGRIVGERMRTAADLDEVAAAYPPAPADVLDGRHRGEQVFVLAAGPDTATPGQHGFNLIRTGRADDARWRIDLDSSGTARIDPLGVAVTATRATEPELDGLVGLLAPAAPLPPGDDSRPPIPDPPQPPLSAAALRTAAVRILVLGPAAVEAPRPVEPERLDLLTEAAVCLALHPEGIRPETLGAMLWPLGVTGDVVAATVGRLRNWFGNDSQGIPHVREDVDGRLILGPDVVCDWDVLRSLLYASRRSDLHDEVGLLLDALRLVRGQVDSELPHGRYSWLARVRTAREADALITDAAHRVFQILHDTDPDGAALAVGTGLKVVDLDQRLWRDRLRLAAVRGRDELLAELDVLLDAAGAEDVMHVDPATAALVEELAPGASVRRTTA